MPSPARNLLLLLCLLLPSQPWAQQAAPVTPHPPAPAPATQPVTPVAPVAGPRVAFETSMGRIVFELYPDKAPKTVANFLAYVEDGHYNGTIFHRVIGNFLVQGGAFTPDMQQKPDRAPVPNESGNGLSNLRGTLAAARRTGEVTSATSQFFVNTVDNRPLDWRGDATPAMAGYCVFGRVVEGMDVIDRMRVVPTGAKPPFAADVPVSPVLVERATLLEE